MMTDEQKLTLPAMPALWSKSDIYISRRNLAGALAHWAVIQSPYTVPENLGAAVEQFVEKWEGEWGSGDCLLSSSTLMTAIDRTIHQCPLIVAWNTPKIEGAVNPELNTAFISRYEAIKPDYDFIDLGALARNVAHELTLWSQVESAQDAVRETAAQ